MSEDEVERAYVGATLEAIERDVTLRRGAPLPDGWLDDYLARRAQAFERELSRSPARVRRSRRFRRSAGRPASPPRAAS